MVGEPCGGEWEAAERGRVVPSGFSSTERHGLARWRASCLSFPRALLKYNFERPLDIAQDDCLQTADKFGVTKGEITESPSAKIGARTSRKQRR